MASSENAISAVERGCGHGCLVRPRIVCLVAAGATMDLLCLVAADAIKTKAKGHDLVRFAEIEKPLKGKIKEEKEVFAKEDPSSSLFSEEKEDPDKIKEVEGI
ncbi:hypothetical protein WN944_018701 [Citrus x changshan-huyou]|uniref:Uncharacterized protein n=1 Tax=Citrus x changshan-huyou TaxID=2935761 RepID=A0AAP0QFN9_9ROSI